MDWSAVTAEDLVDALREVDWSTPPRPVPEFFSRFTVPRSYSKWTSRLKCNLYYYRTNYFILIMFILGLGFLWKPVAILAAFMTGFSIAFLNDSFAVTFNEKVTRTVRQFSPHLAAKMRPPITSVDSQDACIHAEIRTRIPDTVSWDYHFEHAGDTPVTFTVRSAILKESVDDLEWPGSSIQIQFQPDPPSVIFKGEGHGDLEIEFSYYANPDLLIAFQCDHEVSYRYKYKFLRATTANVPSSVLKENRGSKVTIGRGGMLKIQHLVSVATQGIQSYHNVS